MGVEIAKGPGPEAYLNLKFLESMQKWSPLFGVEHYGHCPAGFSDLPDSYKKPPFAYSPPLDESDEPQELFNGNWSKNQALSRVGGRAVEFDTRGDAVSS
jgi:hypothetical protein